MNNLVSIIIPTYNEEKNIADLIYSIYESAIPCHYEVIVVDDGNDDTAAIAKYLSCKVVNGKRKGLGQAIIDGINNASGNIVLVMDGDKSHNPKFIPDLLNPIVYHGFDMTIGSRYVSGGGTSNWENKRKWQSIIGATIMKIFTGVKDSNSGFFAFRKNILDGIELKADSWKIMLEVLFKGNIVSRKEVPIIFEDRAEGESKNSNMERARHAFHLIKLLVYKFRRYINFAIVGGIGALWYFALLYVLTEFAGLYYMWSAIIATIFAATHNYILNHIWTFRKTKDNNANKTAGWAKYLVTVGIGDGTDLVILYLLTSVFGMWYMLSAFLASGVASVIKYTIVKRWVWGKSKDKFNASSPDYEWISFYKGKPWQKYWKQMIARVVKEFSGKANKVLDIGCGSSPCGILTNHSHYIGMDTNEGKMEYMRNKQLKDCEFKTGSVLSIPYKDKSFDTVLFIEAIEHLNNWDEVDTALSEISRVVKDNGKVIIATPNFGSFAGKIQDKLYSIFQPNAYADDHKVKFDPGILIRKCSEFNLVSQKMDIPMNSDIICSFIKGNKHGNRN